MTMTNLPLFPLPVFLLPQGLTRLRIFEPRYLKMVSLAMKDQGFVIFMENKQGSENVSHTGSWVEIINFDQSDDGLLLIDVRCKSLVDIFSITQDGDNLHHADISVKEHWPEIALDSVTGKLSASLKKVFNDNTALNALYPLPCFTSGNWVVARWLELLPVELVEKDLFLTQYSFNEAKTFLKNIIVT